MTRTSLTRADERLILALRTRKNRAREGLFLAEGVRVAEDALASGIVLRFAIASPTLGDTPRGLELRDRLTAITSLREVSEQELERLTATEAPQGVLLAAEIPGWTLAAVNVAERATVLVLDGVQDPGNFGTLARSADAFAVAAVISLPGTVDPWNPKAVRAAAGSTFRVPVVLASHEDTAAFLRAHTFSVLAADAAGTPIERIARNPRMALVVGNEGAGLRPESRALAHEVVSIPIAGHADSLNVGVAAGILLYQLTRAD